MTCQEMQPLGDYDLCFVSVSIEQFGLTYDIVNFPSLIALDYREDT